MNCFENQLFNQEYVNQTYFQQIRADNYAYEQDKRVLKAVHSFADMLDQVEGMNIEHQQQTFCLCLAEIARRNKWI